MSTAVLEGGYVREDIRLGNEALTRQDLDTARQYFQQVLVTRAPRQNRGRVGKPLTPNSRQRPLRIALSVPLINQWW